MATLSCYFRKLEAQQVWGLLIRGYICSLVLQLSIYHWTDAIFPLFSPMVDTKDAVPTNSECKILSFANVNQGSKLHLSHTE